MEYHQGDLAVGQKKPEAVPSVEGCLSVLAGVGRVARLSQTIDGQ